MQSLADELLKQKVSGTRASRYGRRLWTRRKSGTFTDDHGQASPHRPKDAQARRSLIHASIGIEIVATELDE